MQALHTFHRSPVSQNHSDSISVDGQIVECEAGEVAVSPVQARILSHILSAKRGKTLNEIIEAVYFDDPNCGPDAPENTTRVQISKARKKLAPFGICIKVYGGRYIITRREDEKAATDGAGRRRNVAPSRRGSCQRSP